LIGHHFSGVRSPRGSTFINDIVCDLSLRLESTFAKHPRYTPAWTHRQYNGGRLSVRDFLAISLDHAHLVKKCEVNYDIDVNTDHRLISLRLDFGQEPLGTSKMRSVRKPVGWTCSNALKYNVMVTNALAEGPLSLDGFTAVVASAAASLATPAPQRRCAEKGEDVINTLLCKRNSTDDPTERLKLTKEAWKLRRSTKRAREKADLTNAVKGFSQYRSGLGVSRRTLQAAAVLQDAFGCMYENKMDWPAVMSQFYGQIYHDLAPGRGLLLDTERQQRAQAPELVSLDELKLALSSLKPRRSCSSDLLVSEMLQALDDINLSFLCSCLNEVLLGLRLAPLAWQHVEAVLLPKVKAAKSICDFRPITIIPVLRKLYSTILLARAKGFLQNQGEYMFAFRQSYQPAEMLQTARIIVEKANEWGDPLYFVKLDLEKAFDRISRGALVQCLRGRGLPEYLIQGLVLQYSGATCTFRHPSGVCSDSVQLLRGTPQGDPCSPLLFTAVLDCVFERLQRKWSQERRGFLCRRERGEEDYLHNLLAFADDILLIASNVEDAQVMTSDTAAALREVGLHSRPDKCEWSTNCCDSLGGELFLEGFLLPRRSRTEGVKLLRSPVSLDSDSHGAWSSRHARAWALWREKQRLLTSDASLRDKVAVLDATVLQGLLWGTETLVTSRRQRQKLDSLQLELASRMMRVTRREGEQWLPWYQRRLRAARCQLKEFGTLRWSSQWLYRYRCWAGHLARLPSQRYAVCITFWRDRMWQLFQAGRLRRPRPGKPTRWEDCLCEDIGMNNFWPMLAQQREQWRTFCLSGKQAW
jgi:hypothetical protein